MTLLLFGVLLLLAVEVSHGALPLGFHPARSSSLQDFPPLKTPLRTLAEARHFFIGSMANTHWINESLHYRELVATQYNLVTSATLYWSEVEPERNVFNFAPSELIQAFAKNHSQTVRCHNLIWHQTLPSWVNSSLPHTELQAIAKNHVQTIVRHLKGRCYAYDVVNEPIDSDGKLRETIWYDALGEDYIATVLGWVHEIDPDAKLFVNEYGIESVNTKSDGLYTFLKSLKEKGAPLHGVGFESHFTEYNHWPNMSSIMENMQRFASLGLDIHITELDVSLKGAQGVSLAEQLYAQAEFYHNYLFTCLRVPECKSFETWDCTDRFSWLGMIEHDPSGKVDQSVLSESGYIFAPLPFDAIYNPKPAAKAMATALLER